MRHRQVLPMGTPGRLCLAGDQLFVAYADAVAEHAGEAPGQKRMHDTGIKAVMQGDTVYWYNDPRPRPAPQSQL